MSEIKLYEGIKERLREKIKDQFADLIPQEEWDRMLHEEFNKFSQGNSCEMRDLIRDMIKDRFKESASEIFKSPEFNSTWNGSGHHIAGEAVRKIIKENSEDIIASLVGTIVQRSVEQMRSSMGMY